MKSLSKEERGIIFFDSDCVFCSSCVRFIIKNDPKAYFSFASLHSELAQNILKEFGSKQNMLHSIILLENSLVFSESTAVLKIAGRLGVPWKVFSLLLVIPIPIRDLIYRWIAKNRYRWGDSKTCIIPHSIEKDRFLD